MQVGRMIFGKLKRKKQHKGIRVSARPLFIAPKIKDECFRGLTEQSNALAEEARLEGTLDIWDGKLRCECGASVGARTTSMGAYLVPTRHTVYKEPRQPARKRDYGKRI